MLSAALYGPNAARETFEKFEFKSSPAPKLFFTFSPYRAGKMPSSLYDLPPGFSESIMASFRRIRANERVSMLTICDSQGNVLVSDDNMLSLVSVHHFNTLLSVARSLVRTLDPTNELHAIRFESTTSEYIALGTSEGLIFCRILNPRLASEPIRKL